MRRALLGVPALLVVLAGCGPAASSAGAAGSSADAGPRAAITSPAADRFKSPRTYREVAEPVRLRIPAIDVDTPLEHLGRTAHATEAGPAGSIALPVDEMKAGWFDEGPRPGEPGPAVIIGHVNWDHGPAVFLRLRELDPGAKLFVDRADGSVAEFRVTRRKQVAKSDFPTDEVYAPDLAPSLRLITCGGPYDAANRNYLDNIIVFATPA